MNNQRSICRGANPRDCRSDELKAVIAAVTKAVDDLGLAIADAGYTWTPGMRKAYEKAFAELKTP